MDINAENLTLQTARLTLRPPVPADREAVVAGMNDFEVTKWLSVVPHPYTLADADWFIDHVAQGGEQTWFIHDASGLIGGIGLGVELGYWLARPVWGRGYMTEAGRAVLVHLFADPAQSEITAGHFVLNTASGNVLRKLGFVPTHLRIRPCKARGHDMDSQELLLTRARWQSLSNPR